MKVEYWKLNIEAISTFVWTSNIDSWILKRHLPPSKTSCSIHFRLLKLSTFLVRGFCFHSVGKENKPTLMVRVKIPGTPLTSLCSSHIHPCIHPSIHPSIFQINVLYCSGWRLNLREAKCWATWLLLISEILLMKCPYLSVQSDAGIPPLKPILCLGKYFLALIMLIVKILILNQISTDINIVLYINCTQISTAW